MLYPKPRLQEALHQDPALAKSVWQKLNEIDSRTMIGEGRVYGGGLHKLEPKELANVPVDEIAKMIGTDYSLKEEQLMLCERP